MVGFDIGDISEFIFPILRYHLPDVGWVCPFRVARGLPLLDSLIMPFTGIFGRYPDGIEVKSIIIGLGKP